jgi:phosphoglycerate dehydrogenase-like enzyme
MVRVALLDDYQDVALTSADWSALPAGTDVQAFRDHLADENALVQRLEPFEVVMALRERTRFSRPLLQRLPRLGLLTTAGRRNAAIDVDAATDLGIVVSGTEGGPPGHSGARSTAELTWGLILSLARSIPREHNATRAGAWEETIGISLESRVLGLVGLGNIGAQMAEIGRAFHMELIAWSTNLTAERARECGAEFVEKDHLLRRADFVTIHQQLSDRTHGLLGARELGLMRPDAYLVNTSRGPIVDEAALIDALKNRRIAGAGLDVFDVEPLPAGHPFLSLDNVVLTPHLGFVTREQYAGAFYPQTVENIRAWLEGAPVRVLNPEVLGKQRSG